MGPHRDTHVCKQLCKGVGEAWDVSWPCIHILMHVHLLTKVWDQMKGNWDMYKGLHRGTHGAGMQRGGVRWTCIHVLMHVHILTKEWDQNKGVDWAKHTRPHRSTHVYAQVYQGSGADMGSQVSMHTCTDAYSHF